MAAAEIPGFYWMQASNPGTLAFLLVDPFRLLDDFSVDLPDTELVHLETNHAPDVGVMAIVTLPARLLGWWRGNPFPLFRHGLRCVPDRWQAVPRRSW